MPKSAARVSKDQEKEIADLLKGFEVVEEETAMGT